jgi:hypothetical protein
MKYLRAMVTVASFHMYEGRGVGKEGSQRAIRSTSDEIDSALYFIPLDWWNLRLGVRLAADQITDHLPGEV